MRIAKTEFAGEMELRLTKIIKWSYSTCLVLSILYGYKKFTIHHGKCKVYNTDGTRSVGLCNMMYVVHTHLFMTMRKINISVVQRHLVGREGIVDMVDSALYLSSNIMESFMESFYL